MLSYVANDEARGTMLAAQYLASLLHGHGTIAIIGIMSHSETNLTREQDFETALAEVAPAVRIVDRHFGDTALTHQQQIAQEILQRKEPVDAIIAVSAMATRGAYYARLANKASANVKIIGFDQDMLLPLETGYVDAVVAQDTAAIGKAAMHNLSLQMHDEQAPGLTLIPPVLVTHSNLAWAVDHGFFSIPVYRWSGQ
ncbi:sugar ABC transporter substrate-binding protein [Granulicella cerasi]|uniref:Sugar ABC transporter substrate-binding protein n=1 Tax=Granulicella cerasi TaxID=741063 RepID=A0ABW1ZB06_9BACT